MFIKDPNFTIKKSLIPNAGKGVFANKDFKKYELLGEYKGIILTPKEYRKINKHKPLLYVWELKDEDDDVIAYIDGEDLNYSNFTRYVNTPVSEDDASVMPIQKGFRLFYYASKDIKKGEEILVHYGDPYLEYLGLI